MRRLFLPVYRAARACFGGHDLSRFRLFRTVHEAVVRRLKTDVAMVRGHKMYLDAPDAMNLSIAGTYEDRETDLLLATVRPGDEVFDIGAHIGYHTLQLARLVGGSGRVFAFEPGPDNFALLRRNVEINGYRNVRLVNAAVGESSGEIRLFLSPENPGDHRTYDSHDGRDSVDVRCVALDEYFQGDPPAVRFIKMDIQGAEMGAVRGMRRLLDHRSELTLVTEFWPAGLRRFGGDAAQYLDLLQACGFDVREIDAQSGSLREVERRALLERNPIESEAFTNLFCVKSPGDGGQG